VRDFAQVRGEGKIDQAIADRALKLLEVDEMGLDKMDRKILSTVLEKFNGGPVGLETLAVAVNEEKETLEDVYEPYLIQVGFLDRTPRGRRITPLGAGHLGKQTRHFPQERLL
jgi:Holliday junction DNA helicase RuvB